MVATCRPCLHERAPVPAVTTVIDMHEQVEAQLASRLGDDGDAMLSPEELAAIDQIEALLASLHARPGGAAAGVQPAVARGWRRTRRGRGGVRKSARVSRSERHPCPAGRVRRRRGRRGAARGGFWTASISWARSGLPKI